MKTRIALLFCILVCFSFIGTAQAADTDSQQDTEALIQQLQEQLSEAKDHVSELETKLQNAQSTIKQLEDQSTSQLVETVQTEKAVNRSVQGQPLYDANNPKLAIQPKTVMAEKYTPETQNQPVAATRLLEDDIDRSGIFARRFY